jgi:hypothetical protein
LRNFYWNVFAVTGSIDAYLMYKEVDGIKDDSAKDREEEHDREEVH